MEDIKKSVKEGNENNVDVIDEPEFQPDANQVDVDQIGEPPQHNLQPIKFNGN